MQQSTKTARPELTSQKRSLAFDDEVIVHNRIFSLLFLLGMITPVCAQNDSDETKSVSNEQPNTISSEYLIGTDFEARPDTALQISEYVRRILQDRSGNLWFATNDKGVCKYDGKTFTYFSTREGLNGNQVRGIVEDNKGNIWFATSGGLAKYNGVSIVNYTNIDEPSDRGFKSIIIDRAGTIWVGGLNGVSRFDGENFTPFPIFKPKEIDVGDVPWMVESIIEDRAGNIWFGTYGAGVFRYDGNDLINLSEKDGLNGNFVCCILEAKDGNLWFGTRNNGVGRYDGESFTNYTTGELVWNVHEDKTGNIWFTSLGVGVYRYDGKSFTNFNQKDGLGNLAVQSILEDREGRLWFGTGAGLYRYDGESFFNVTKDGPWE